MVRVWASVVVVLAALGIYGVLSLQVGARQREIAVRLALGATARRVRRAVLGSALRLACAGIVLGLLGSLLLARFMETVLYEVSSTDAATYTARTARSGIEDAGQILWTDPKVRLSLWKEPTSPSEDAGT